MYDGGGARVTDPECSGTGEPYDGPHRVGNCRLLSLGEARMVEVGFVPEERWPSLPVQPTAGAWRRRRRWTALAVAAAALWAVVADAWVVTGAAAAGANVWDPIGPFVLVSVLAIVMSVRQARAERAEQQHGYTTLPVRGRAVPR